MKTHRSILFLSFFATFISLIFILLLSQATKGFQIVLAFMGSSFISFLLEFPVFMSLKKENSNRLYYSLHDIKLNTFFLVVNINNFLSANSIVTDKFYDQNIQKISEYINSLRCFDANYYFFKKKNVLMSGIINSICNAFNNVNQSSLKYSVNYYDKRLNNNINEGCDRNIFVNEMTHELNDILQNSEALIKIIDIHAVHIFSKAQYKSWLIDNSNLINSNNALKIIQK